MLYEAKFDVHTKVHIDGDRSIAAVVVAILFENYGVSYKLNWFNNGELKEAWVAEPRLSK